VILFQESFAQCATFWHVGFAICIDQKINLTLPAVLFKRLVNANI
jgi:hypothetical protein